MAIEDPTAIPENGDAALEYLTEADTDFDNNNSDRAEQLYRSAVYSQHLPDDRAQHARYRLGSIAIAAGNNDEAYSYLDGCTAPGAAELLRAIDNSTTDAPVDPSVAPASREDVSRYWNAADSARRNNDPETAEALARAIANSSEASPDMAAGASVMVAQIAQAAHRNDEAREWAEAALALGAAAEDHAAAQAVLTAVGAHAEDANPYETAASQQLYQGIEKWQAGDQTGATTDFQAVLAATEGATDVDKGKAAFYLGSMAYYAQRYAEAREHLHRARDDAEDPEKSWATEMLEWRWQEEG